MARGTLLTAADLHRGASLYGLLAQAVARHRPDIVAVMRDFHDGIGWTAGKLTTQNSAKTVAQ